MTKLAASCRKFRVKLLKKRLLEKEIVFYRCCAKCGPSPPGICEMEERPLYPAKAPLQPWQTPVHTQTHKSR